MNERIFITAFCFFVLCLDSYAQQTVLRGLEGRTMDDERVTSYVVPSRIMWQTDNVTGSEFLLRAEPAQPTTRTDGFCVLDTRQGGQASILLDFGKELQGGIRIGAAIRENKNKVQIRIRLGESVSEAMSDVNSTTATNDHSLRDFEIEVPWLGLVELGESGFRFARIDLLTGDEVLPLQSVHAAFRYRDIPYLGSFESDDPRLNEIWAVGAYTVHLNMQDYVWDGIKRDRLVWLGDLHPELMTINTVFGDSPLLRATLDFGRDHTPLPGWMNGMCSYSLWWIISHRDLYRYQGDEAYLAMQQEYLGSLVDQIIADLDGKRENLSGQRFLDWPTSESPKIIHAGLQALTVMALEAAAEIGQALGNRELTEKSTSATLNLREYVPYHENNKQAAALLTLAGLGDPTTYAREIIGSKGAHGFSTFYGYYMLEAMARAGLYTEAMSIISDYWGAMLDLGATTFWEDLDYTDALKASRIDEFVPEGGFDIHAMSGAYCYEGLRHSFCHGWASGPTAWLSRHVLGIYPLESGCRVLEVRPNLGNLSWARGTLPTPHGLVSVEHIRTDSGAVVTRIDAPEGVRVIQGQ